MWPCPEHTKAIISPPCAASPTCPPSSRWVVYRLHGTEPSRTIAKFGLKAVLAGSLSNLMSATIAGFFLALSGM